MLPDSKVHEAYMGPTWALSAPDGPHVPCYQGCYNVGDISDISESDYINWNLNRHPTNS